MGYGPLEAMLTGLGLILFVVKIFGLIDAVQRPAAAFPAADKQTKGLWTILLGVAVVWDAIPVLLTGSLTFHPLNIIGIVGVVVALVYLLDVRPALRAMGGGRGGRPARGPSGW